MLYVVANVSYVANHKKGQLHLGRAEEQLKFCFDVNYSGKYNTALFFEVFFFF